MLKHNSKLYKLLSVFSNPSLWQPVLFLFFTITQGLSATEALFLNSIYSISVVILEVPSGAVSDHFSRKFSAALGYLLKGAGIALLTVTNNYQLLMLFMILAAFGESLTSGSIESLMYDTLAEDKSKAKKRFKHLFASTRTLLHLSMSVYILAGGFIGSYNLALPLIVSLFFYLVAAYVCLQFIEPKQEIQQEKYFDHVVNGLKLVFSKQGYNSGLTLMMVSSYFILGIISASFWLTTPILENVGFKIAVIGLFTAGMRVMKSLGSYLVSKYDDDNDFRAMLITGIIIALLFLIAGSFFNAPVIIIMLMILYLTQAFYQANNVQLLNDRINSVDRTTINSIQNVFVRLYEFTILPIIGVFIDNGEIRQGMLLIGGLVIVGVVIMLINKKQLISNN